VIRFGFCFYRLQNIGKIIKNILKGYFQLSEGMAKTSTWPNSNEKALQQFSEEIDHSVIGDVLFPLKEYYCKKSGLPAPGDPSDLPV